MVDNPETSYMEQTIGVTEESRRIKQSQFTALAMVRWGPDLVGVLLHLILLTAVEHVDNAYSL